MKNIITNTNPIIIHAPGSTSKKNIIWENIKEFFIKLNKKSFNVKDITIITWNSRNKKSLLESVLDEYKIKYILLGKGILDWKNTYKINLTKNILSEIKTKYVMGLDADDIILLDNPENYLFVLEKNNCKMLLNAEIEFWLDCGKQFITEKWKKFQESTSNTIYKYLNSGAWIAEIEFSKEFFNSLENNNILNFIKESKLPAKVSNWNGNILNDDQIIFHSRFVDFYPEIKLDINCELFQTLSFHDSTMIQWENKIKLI